MRLAIALALILAANTLCAQTAYYGGRAYTPENYPQAMWHTDGMCRNIRSQWQAQGWVSGAGANKVMRWSVATSQVVAPTVQAAPKLQSQSLTQGSVEYRTVTKYRTETYQVQVCIGKNRRGQCIFQTRTATRTVPYTVTELVPKSIQKTPEPARQPTSSPKPIVPALPKIEKTKAIEPASDETSPALARRVLEIVSPSPSDAIVDLGCGTGALLAAAAPYGSRLIGVELDAERAKKAQWRIPSAEIIQGDILKQDYSEGNIFLAYLFPDLLADVLDKLPAGALLVSLEHDIPGIECDKRLIVLDDQSRHFIYTATIRSEASSVATTFGL